VYNDRLSGTKRVAAVALSLIKVAPVIDIELPPFIELVNRKPVVAGNLPENNSGERMHGVVAQIETRLRPPRLSLRFLVGRLCGAQSSAGDAGA